MEITIITPSYNRAKILPACYESLKRQTLKDFLWMIVDDGSTDDTNVIVSNWIGECTEFSIEYIKKENGGKASALNKAFDKLKTPYACVLDSDDKLSPYAIEKALNILKIHNDEEYCCGLMAFRHNPDGSVMGGKNIPLIKHYTMFNQVNGDYHTELICFYKSSIIKKYRFPYFEGEKFVSPQWLDYELSRNYYFITSQDVFCICAYIDDGITKNKKNIIINNPRGYTAVKSQSFEFSKSIKPALKHGFMYNYGCLLSRDKYWFDNSPKKFLSIILMPFAYIYYKIKH